MSMLVKQETMIGQVHIPYARLYLACINIDICKIDRADIEGPYNAHSNKPVTHWRMSAVESHNRKRVRVHRLRFAQNAFGGSTGLVRGVMAIP